MFLFRKFNIIELIDKLNIDFENGQNTKIKDKETILKTAKITFRKKISDKIKINEITAKASAYYIFLVFFRLSIVII
jgi:hypothetical protein